jgi:phosphocarrier protein HPr
MIREALTIQNKLGIHARAAAKLVDTAKRFGSKIEIILRGRSVDCKSIMGVITLGAQKDNIVEFVITGEDETEAFEALEKLINGKFGED